jgi:putative DNA primase/helicase
MSMEKTKDAARGRWRGIITTLGIDPAFLDGKHHKCPFCGGKDRFRFDDKDGSGSYFCSGCKPGLGMDLVMNARGWDFATAAREVDGLVGTVQKDEIRAERSEQEKVGALKKLGFTSQKLAPGTASWTYLERRCGDPTGISGLAHHPSLRYDLQNPLRYPALLASLRDSVGELVSIHRTYLTPDGYKANLDPVRKIMPGRPLEGAAVRLKGVQERLGIAEGVETAISSGKIFNLPVWSTLSANGILSWVPPEGVKSVVIFGDNDAHKLFEGQKAAFAKAQALRLKGFDVEVMIPPNPGDDWNDVWGQAQTGMVA